MVFGSEKLLIASRQVLDMQLSKFAACSCGDSTSCEELLARCCKRIPKLRDVVTIQAALPSGSRSLQSEVTLVCKLVEAVALQ